MSEEIKKTKDKAAKVIQISTSTSGSGLVAVVALRDDGTIWFKYLTVNAEWKQLT